MPPLMTKTPLAAALTLALASTQAAHAQDLALEEVVVTATKRSVGLQDVPIALAVVSGENIIDNGVRNLEDLSVLVPTITIAESSGSTFIYIRGIGSPGGGGFEQSVGTFVDGIYFGRDQAARNAMLDIERVEVLKGPQSTLFGKNTIAGALNITTAKPSDEFEAILRASYEPEFEGWSGTAIVSGAITDNLQGRAVIKYAETDGYMDNKYLDRPERSLDDTVGRITLAWQPTDTLDVTLKYENGQTDSKGRPHTIGIATEDALALYRSVAPDFQADVDYDKWSANDPRLPQDFEEREWEIATLTAEWDVGEHTIRSITGYIDSEVENYVDVDFGPLELIGQRRFEAHEQFSQEFLLSSPLNDKFEYLAGLYYQDEDLETRGGSDVQLSALGFPESFNVSGQERFEQDAESWSAFTQLTWHFNDSLRVIGGLRYSEDDKEFEKSDYAAEYLQTEESARLGGIYDALLNFSTAHWFGSHGATICEGLAYVCTDYPDFDNTIEEDHWTGDITLQWDMNDSIMSYAKIANGYKAGGFDSGNGRASLEKARFEPENVQGIEIGAKMDVLDGRGRLNIAAYYNEFEDVQVSVFDGTANFNVDNAAESESYGIDIDGSFLLTENIMLTGALSWLDASWIEFEDAPCTATQEANAPDGETCVQDLSGQDTNFSPKWSGNLAIQYDTSLTNSLDFAASASVNFSDDYHTVTDNDPIIEQDSYAKWNARVALLATDGSWTVALVGKNLTDETIANAPNDIPLGSQGFRGSYFHFLSAPRSYEVQAEYRF